MQLSDLIDTDLIDADLIFWKFSIQCNFLGKVSGKLLSIIRLLGHNRACGCFVLALL